jgi:hypothetical protein
MASAQPLIDHDRIRQWAEERDARPACVKGTGGKNDTGMIRLDFPGFSGARSLQPISWTEWFRQFDANNLALLVQETTGRGRQSNFNKLVARTGQGSRRSTANSTTTRKQTTTRGTRGRKTAAKSSTRRAASASTMRKTKPASRKTARGTKKATTRKTTRGAAAGGRKRTRGR